MKVLSVLEEPAAVTTMTGPGVAPSGTTQTISGVRPRPVLGGRHPVEGYVGGSLPALPLPAPLESPKLCPLWSPVYRVGRKAG